jgi:hypothetical protein
MDNPSRVNNELIRRKLLSYLGCSEDLINFNLAIQAVRNGRTSFDYGHDFMAEIMGFANRYPMTRVLKQWQEFESRSGYKIADITSGGGNDKKITNYGTDHLERVISFIQGQVSKDADQGRELPEVLIGRYLKAGLKKLPSSLSLVKNKKRIGKSKGKVIRDVLSSSDPAHTPMLADALQFAFPATGKVPAVRGWRTFPYRSDKAKAKAWKADSNIAIVTGEKLPDGRYLCVLDVDPRNKGDWSLKNLLTKHSITLPKTLTVKTGGGGNHLYYSTDKPFQSGSNVFGNGLDFKSYGGYVIGPGSTHGKDYTIVDDAPIAHLPEELVGYLKEHTPPILRVSEGERHKFLTRVAGCEIGRGKTDPETEAILQQKVSRLAAGNRQITQKEIDGIIKWTRTKENTKRKAATGTYGQPAMKATKTKVTNCHDF